MGDRKAFLAGMALSLGLVLSTALVLLTFPTLDANAFTPGRGGGGTAVAVADGCATGDACVLASVASSGAVSGTTFAGTSFTSSAGSGQTAFSAATDGARVKIGPAAYFYGHSASKIAVAGTGFTITDGAFEMTGVGVYADFFGSVQMKNSQGNNPLKIDDANGLLIKPYALTDTCGTGNTVEGTIMVVAANGSNDTKICLCSASAATTPTYKWINLQDPTEMGGSTTVCPDVARF